MRRFSSERPLNSNLCSSTTASGLRGRRRHARRRSLFLHGKAKCEAGGRAGNKREIFFKKEAKTPSREASPHSREPLSESFSRTLRRLYGTVNSGKIFLGSSKQRGSPLQEETASCGLRTLRGDPVRRHRVASRRGGSEDKATSVGRSDTRGDALASSELP